MSKLSELFGLSKSQAYEDAVRRRQETGRLTTGGTGYSDRQTRGLQFAQDVARGWSAQALGDSMGYGQNLGARVNNAVKTTESGVMNNNIYDALNGLDEAKRRSEGLQVAEANEQEKAKSDRFYNTLQTGINAAGTLMQGAAMARGGTTEATSADTKPEETAQTSK